MDVLRGMSRTNLSIGADGPTCPPGSEVDVIPGADPRAPIHRAWVAGRLAIAFDETNGEPGAGEIPAAGAAGCPGARGARGIDHSIEALDVSERPYIWDL